jgi:type IV secretory pathway TraG/TraD family ATPase VirD4
MSATKILWGQVVLVSAVVLAFLWTATEWTAWQLGFQPQLGQPWFAFLRWPVYQPPAFFWCGSPMTPTLTTFSSFRVGTRAPLRAQCIA